MLKFYKATVTSSLIALAIGVCSSTAVAESTAEKLAKGYEPPRLANGQPDFQGVWTNVSLTGLTRPARYKSLTMSEEDALKMQAMVEARQKAGLKPTDPNEGAPAKGSVGGYNSFWVASGERLAKIDGKYRTSWIVEPENGQLPYSKKGMEIFKAKQSEARTNFDGPEPRSVGDRCLVGFGSSGGPPMLNVMYNNNYRIVQSEDAVMILVEMNHDARIIRLSKEHKPEELSQWLGDSIAWWDGDTLVVKSKNFKEAEALRLYFSASYYMSENAEVTERLTRISDNELFYEFTVDDPEIYTQPWRGEMVFNTTSDEIYEYACHEGNYAMTNILAGARKEEKDAKKK
ncbi:hypothetical protein [Aurantivibrio plasticivorans]